MTHALLVDDDTELRTLVADYLRRNGMSVTAVDDGAAVRRLMPGGGFDVLVLDLMLPDANGLDLCRWVRATSALPIIMLTAQGDPTSRIVGLELGADKYLPKPFEPRELVARRDRLLDLSRAPGVNMTDRAIDLAVSRRRQKLGDSPKQPPLIRTVRGEGYVFDAEPLK